MYATRSKPPSSFLRKCRRTTSTIPQPTAAKLQLSLLPREYFLLQKTEITHRLKLTQRAKFFLSPSKTVQAHGFLHYKPKNKNNKKSRIQYGWKLNKTDEVSRKQTKEPSLTHIHGSQPFFLKRFTQ